MLIISDKHFYAFNVSYREASIEEANWEKTILEKFLSPSTYSFGTYSELEILLELYFWRDEFALIFRWKQILVYNYPRP